MAARLIQPAFVLIQPQLAENLGAVARAMANFGFNELRLVAPVCDPLDSKAIATAAGADNLLHHAKIYPDWQAAVGDCQWLLGTCGNQRHLIKEYVPLPLLNKEIDAKLSSNKVAIIFGPERTGLDNDILSRCHAIIQIPSNPDFSSINLSQAVILIAYQLSQQDCIFKKELVVGETGLASQEQLHAFLKYLEDTLGAQEYWRVVSKKTNMWRNLQNIFTRLQLTSQDIQTLWGMFNTLAKKR